MKHFIKKIRKARQLNFNVWYFSFYVVKTDKKYKLTNK